MVVHNEDIIEKGQFTCIQSPHSRRSNIVEFALYTSQNVLKAARINFVSNCLRNVLLNPNTNRNVLASRLNVRDTRSSYRKPGRMGALVILHPPIAVCYSSDRSYSQIYFSISYKQSQPAAVQGHITAKKSIFHILE